MAGKRAGLAGERSGLFMEQIRIVKEMRDECARQIQLRGTDEPIRPRYMVWENVPGAFSSNKGADFQAVLEETAKVAERDASIPGPPGGKWPSAGCVMGNGWSIAWRLHDAQFWGVPQRRKRIALVADFGGETAPEILFERKGVSGDSEQSKQTGQEVAASVGRGANPSSYTLKVRGGREIDSKGHKAGKGALVQTELSGTLGVSQDQTLIQTTSDGSEVAGTLDASYYKGCGLRQGRERTVVYGISAYDSNAMKSSNPNSGVYKADTSRTLDNNGGNPACNQGGMMVVQGFDSYNLAETGQVGRCLSAAGGGLNEHTPVVCIEGNSTEHHAVCVENHPADSRVQIKEDGVVQTLSGRMGTGGGNVPLIMNTAWDGSQVSPTLTANNAGGNQRMPDKDNFNAVLTYDLDRASFNQGKNAQYDFAIEEEKIGTQVAKGPGAVCTEGGYNAETRNQILCLLQETYGAETVFKWGVTVLDALQQTDVLQQRVHEGSVQSEAKNGEKLDGGALPCPSVVAGWLLRDMRQREECGCASQGWKSTEQRLEQSDESMPELSQQNPQTCKDLFDMWEKSQGLGLLRETLSEIQKIRQSFDGQRQSVHRYSIVRRLTPLEAERLQGFPDHWTDIGEWVDTKGKVHKDADSPRYKALGNSIALPFWQWMAGRMVSHLGEYPTMASLFDGIGGFPLVFSRCGCEPIWASEIEEFPIAVTKKHFPDVS